MSKISWDERSARESAHHANVTAIVAKLGAGWTATQPHEHKGYMSAKRADGLAIHFVLDAYNGRVEVTPHVPQDNRGGMSSLRDWGVISHDAPNAAKPGMSYSIDRDPARVAAEITRKVVEPYAPMYAAIIARKAEQLKAYEAGVAAANEVATVFNDPPRQSLDFKRGESAQFNLRPYNEGRINPSVTVSLYGGGMRFQIDCGAEIGIELAKALAKFAAR